MTLYRADVEVNGMRLSSEWGARLTRVVVDDNLQFPAMFELAFIDPDNAGIDGSGLSIGSTVKVSAQSETGSETLLEGEVTALEAEFDALGVVVVARGYDKVHRLHHGRKTRAWLEKTDSDVAEEIAQEAGLTATVDSTSVTHAYLVQSGLTDWEFLRSRARAIGYDLRGDSGTLLFQEPQEPSEAPGDGSYSRVGERQLVYGLNLRAFRPRVTAAEQVTSVEARGWDPAQKQAVTATAQAATKTASLTGQTPSGLAGSVSAGSYVAVTEPHASSDEAQAAAEAIAERIGSVAIEAEGTASGSPFLRAGAEVNISDVGSTFAGKYVLSATRHVFDVEGYTTHFVVSGRQERSLLGLTSAGATNEEPHPTGPLYGVTLGLVTDIGDEENQGRVKVKLPALSEDYSTEWARVAYVGAGADRGLFVPPAVDDEVVVIFAHGDPRRPIVLGSLFNGQDKPKDAASAISNGEIKKRVWTSGAGHAIEFRDGDDDSAAKLSTTGGLKIELDDTNTKITISSGGEVSITGSTDVKVEASAGLTLKGGSELKLSAPTISISADGSAEVKSGGQLTLQGANTDLKGDGMLNVQSSGIAQIQGSLVKIN